MAEPLTTYISSSWLEPLWKRLKASRGERAREIEQITNEFVAPHDLAPYYVEPDCQHHNPADHLEDQEPRSAVKSPVFRTRNDFLDMRRWSRPGWTARSASCGARDTKTSLPRRFPRPACWSPSTCKKMACASSPKAS